MVDQARYAFKLSAWNELAGVDDHFVLHYFRKNNGSSDVEIMGAKRKQLARIAYPHLRAEDIRPGGKLVIFGKQYRVEDYEDRHTRDALGRAQQGCVFLI